MRRVGILQLQSLKKFKNLHKYIKKIEKNKYIKECYLKFVLILKKNSKKLCRQNKYVLRPYTFIYLKKIKNK